MDTTNRDEHRLLPDLLDSALAYDPVTAAGFSDHLPMALVALGRLGAPDTRLLEFHDRYARGLVPARAEFLTEQSRHAAEIDGAGIDAIVRRQLPGLLPGLGSAAFHGVIRLAYAVEARHEGQVAAALAFFDEVFAPLSAEPPAEVDGDPLVLLDVLRTTAPVGAEPFVARSISEQMALVAGEPGFAAVGGIAPGEHSLERIAAAARATFASTAHFTALHAVTGTHAARVLLPYLDEADRALAIRFLYQAIAAAYLTIGSPPIHEPAMPDPPPWDRIVTTAVASDDEHDIKLAYSAHDEAMTWGHDDAYRTCAALRVGLA